MKKSLLFFSLLLIKFSVSAQPQVQIICNSNNCFNTDPTPLEAIYEATFTNEPQGYTRVITWVATPQTAYCCDLSVDNNLRYKLKWNNSPNSPTREIEVKVVYTDTTSANRDPITVSKKQTVVVKHIGPITSMTISGASPSSPTNGSTVAVPCGANSFTISVTPPATDPASAINYTWSLPANWTGSSTTNSITVTPNAGGGGTISVFAQRADGTVARGYSVNVTRPVVESALISSISWSPDDKPLCTGETRQLSGAGSVNANIFTWSTTGGTSITGASNQSTVTVSGTSNGTLKLIASNACGVSKDRTWNIYANVPQIASSEVLVDGHPNYYPNYTTGSSYINVQGGGNCQTYKWELYGGSGYINPNYCSCGYAYNGITFDHCNAGSASTSSSMAIRLRTANRCGQGNDVIIPLEVSGGGGYYRMSSPNPATTTITIELDKAKASNLNVLNIVSATRSKIARSFDVAAAKSSNYFKTNNIVSFDVSNLERGLYYVVLNFGENNQSFSELVMLH